MKLPDHLNNQLDAIANRRGISRKAAFFEAISEYYDNHKKVTKISDSNNRSKEDDTLSNL